MKYIMALLNKAFIQKFDSFICNISSCLFGNNVLKITNSPIFLGGGKFYKIVRSCICIFLKGIYRLTKKNVYKSKAKFAKALRYFAIINKLNKKSLSVLEFGNSLFFL